MSLSHAILCIVSFIVLRMGNFYTIRFFICTALLISLPIEDCDILVVLLDRTGSSNIQDSRTADKPFTCGPHNHTIWHIHKLACVFRLEPDVLVGHLKDTTSNFDMHPVPSKLFLCKLADALVKCVEDVVPRLHKSNGDTVLEMWVQTQ